MRLTMDYEKAYKNALERAKKINSGEGVPALPDYSVCETIFPELRESEDDRIRKEIIEFLELPHPQFVGKRHWEEWISWLEKQKPAEWDKDSDKKILELKISIIIGAAATVATILSLICSANFGM